MELLVNSEGNLLFRRRICGSLSSFDLRLFLCNLCSSRVKSVGGKICTTFASPAIALRVRLELSLGVHTCMLQPKQEEKLITDYKS
jgi:hypothetical protein